MLDQLRSAPKPVPPQHPRVPGREPPCRLPDASMAVGCSALANFAAITTAVNTVRAGGGAAGWARAIATSAAGCDHSMDRTQEGRRERAAAGTSRASSTADVTDDGDDAFLPFRRAEHVLAVRGVGRLGWCYCAGGPLIGPTRPISARGRCYRGVRRAVAVAVHCASCARHAATRSLRIARAP